MSTVQSIEIIREQGTARAVHPRKFIVWLFIVAIVMLFAGLTSAYIVRQADGNWLRFQLPSAFRLTSVVIILSSLTMQLAFRAARKDNLRNLKIFISATMILGIVFLAGQYYSWVQLVRQDVFLVGNPSGSFIYVLTGLHGIHLISGLVFLLLVLIASFNYKVHSKNMVSIEMCATYWHFLGGLWIYLFIFLNIYH
jgi:cytochrome c oxidase subunit III